WDLSAGSTKCSISHIVNSLKMITTFQIIMQYTKSEANKSIPDSDKTLSRRDFVSKPSANLSCRERKSFLVEFQQPFEVNKNPLRGFRPPIFEQKTKQKKNK